MRRFSLCFLICTGVLVGCGGKPQPPDRLTFFVSCDTQGHIEPCGCEAGQRGGLARRMTVMERERDATSILIDVGDVAAPHLDPGFVRLTHILKGMEEMGYAAVNLGTREVALKKQDLLAFKDKFKFKFISANVVDEQTLQPIVDTYTVVDRDGYRIGITGVVTDAAEPVGAGLKVLSPQVTLLKVLPEVKRRADFVVVAADVEDDALREIAQRCYEANLVLGGEVKQTWSQPEKVGNAIVFGVTDLGKFLGKLTIEPGENGGVAACDAKVLAMTEDINDHPKMTALINDYIKELERRDISPEEATEGFELLNAPRSASADAYVGAEKCQTCHPQAYAIWKASGHAHGYETLAKKNRHRAHECLICHTVGYGATDGFKSIDRTSPLKGIQCENCHGRGKKHIEFFTQNAGAPYTSTFRLVTVGTCVKCHDKENSSRFNYETYWAKVKHGRA